MAITFDASSSQTGSGAGPFTWSHNNNGNILFVTAGGWFGGGQNFNSVTYNGVALTLIQRSSGATPRAEVWCLVNPPVGTFTVSVGVSSSVGNTARMLAISYNGYDTSVNEAALVAASAKAAGTSTSPSVTVSSGTGNLVFGCVVNGDASVAPAVLTWTDETQRANTAGAGGSDIRNAVADEAGASSVTISGTLASSQAWVDIAVPMTATSAGGSGLVIAHQKIADLSYGVHVHRGVRGLRSGISFAYSPAGIVAPAAKVVARWAHSMTRNRAELVRLIKQGRPSSLGPLGMSPIGGAAPSSPSGSFLISLWRRIVRR